ncbi:MAG: hypothetical protein H6560_20280 [Lewinellaceae bacterium]|nr:hypothetical protein [Lewinellaceae bacterium]
MEIFNKNTRNPVQAKGNKWPLPAKKKLADSDAFVKLWKPMNKSAVFSGRAAGALEKKFCPGNQLPQLWRLAKY